MHIVHRAVIKQLYVMCASYVIVRPLSTVGYTSVASVSTLDSGITNLIHETVVKCEINKLGRLEVSTQA